MQMRLINGDCLEEMAKLEDGSIDMVLTDPPYGTTACKWDSVIPFEPMWEQLKRVTKENAAIALFGSEPFSSMLRVSNMKMFRYDWVWKKDAGSNFYSLKYSPMKEHETISIFCKNKKNPRYFPVMQERVGGRKGRRTKSIDSGRTDSVYGTSKGGMVIMLKEKRFPSSVQSFKRERGLHPTQKPVKLMEYLIKTYTNEGDTVLDFTMGSGTTGIACHNLNRNFIGIEIDKDIFETARNRIDEHTRQQRLF